ncbi:nucleotide exchange factor GrpE [Patescibacteria group bacterium]|nr:nucleotide exchange factor GrpE [Patescibacteria group bacterium]
MTGEKKTEELKRLLEKSEKEKEEYLAGWQRERADFANYKREVKGQMEKGIQRAAEELFHDWFPIIDNMERAESSVPEGTKKDAVVKGFLQITKQLREFLSRHGVKEVETDGFFDPAIHEAVGEEELEGIEPGTIVKVAAKGYEREGKLLRPAKVKIAK